MRTASLLTAKRYNAGAGFGSNYINAPSPWRRLEHPESSCWQQPIQCTKTARSGQVEEMPSKPSLAEARIRSVGEWEHQSLLHKHARWIVGIKPEAFAPDITRPFVKPRRFRLRNSGLKSHDAEPDSTRIRPSGSRMRFPTATPASVFTNIRFNSPYSPPWSR